MLNKLLELVSARGTDSAAKSESSGEGTRALQCLFGQNRQNFAGMELETTSMSGSGVHERMPFPGVQQDDGPRCSGIWQFGLARCSEVCKGSGSIRAEGIGS